MASQSIGTGVPSTAVAVTTSVAVMAGTGRPVAAAEVVVAVEGEEVVTGEEEVAMTSVRWSRSEVFVCVAFLSSPSSSSTYDLTRAGSHHSPPPHLSIPTAFGISPVVIWTIELRYGRLSSLSPCRPFDEIATLPFSRLSLLSELAVLREGSAVSLAKPLRRTETRRESTCVRKRENEKKKVLDDSSFGTTKD